MSNDQKDTLRRLKEIAVTTPANKARDGALNAAMQAFDAVETTQSQENSEPVQGNDWLRRLTSIFSFERIWKMDIRIPVGAAAVGLLLFPLALQLNSTTGLTGFMPQLVSPQEVFDGLGGADMVDDSVVADFGLKEEIASTPQPTRGAGAPVAGVRSEAVGGLVQADETSANRLAKRDGNFSKSAVEMTMPASEPVMMSAPRVADESMLGNFNEAGGDNFAEFEQSSVFVTADNPVSTFSIDVDTASYAYVRRVLEGGQFPQPNAVRVEEMINYFNYDYAAPEAVDVPFKPSVAVYPAPWNENAKLLHIGIKGFQPALVEDRPINLVFLIDTSGSMDAPDKLPLLKRSLALLLDQLSDTDTISIVTYAGSAGTVLEPTSVSNKTAILDALRHLRPGGSTAGAAGIAEAYRLAEAAKTPNGVNRVILATDGDFNVGISEPAQLKRFISQRRDAGISLSVLGFGMGNYNDALMQALAQNGDGNAAYIDSFSEARKVLVDEVQGTLMTIARDVKIQVEFNPATVSEYRLVGYETRALAREDFNNDKVDAGDIGAGHTVTAIYEFTPIGAEGQVDPLRYGTTKPTVAPQPGDEYAFLKMRYKLPGEETSRLIETPVLVGDSVDNLSLVSDDIRFGAAVAAFGQKLRGDPFADGLSFEALRALAIGARGDDAHGYRAEFISLIDIAQSLEMTGQGR